MTLMLKPETEARLLAAARQKGLPPEEVIDAALEALLREGPTPTQAPETDSVQDTPEQARLRAALFDVIAKAQALVPEPRREDPEQAPEERLYGEIITEKYQRQGFNLP